MFKILLRQNVFLVAVGFCSLFITPVEGYLEIPFTIQDPASKSISLSHTEGKGLGYTQGYTSLDLFFAQPFCNSPIIPFLDLRAHIFNNKRFASNAGVGIRWLNSACRRVWGINCFYDFSRTSQLRYHQVAVGLEALGETWDLRINGYLPYGRKSTPIYTLSYDFSSGFLAKAREQFAMKGVDVEIGYHFCKWPCLDLYVGLGPYFYWGRSRETENAFRSTHKQITGGRLRTSANFFTYCELEAVTTYDARFKWTGQVTLSLNIPFDWTCCFEKQDDCCSPCGLLERLYQPVIRNEIIVIDRINRSSTNPAILDPQFEP